MGLCPIVIAHLAVFTTVRGWRAVVNDSDNVFWFNFLNHFPYIDNPINVKISLVFILLTLILFRLFSRI